MKDKILNALLIIVLILLVVEVATQEPENRYEVISGNNNVTILLDKQSGQTWRNCICGEKSNVPGCWEKMITINPENFNKPPQQVPQGQNEPLRIGGWDKDNLKHKKDRI